LLGLVPTIPWLTRLGQPVAGSEDVVQIQSWNEWPGPDHPGADMLSEQLQAWQAELRSTTAWQTEACDGYWQRLGTLVREAASRAVDYDADEDAWHGPSAAVEAAAFVAGLVGCSVALRREPDSRLLRVWRWFVLGHWPFAYEQGVWPDDSGKLMIL
jgi:hypothetical protein